MFVKKTIWITGGTRGIGLATAKCLSEAGHQVVISGRNPAMEYIAEGLFDYNWLDYQNVHFYPYDVTDPSSIDFVQTNIRKQVGEIDILINNAGIFDTNTAEEYTPGKLRSMFAINTFGAIDTMMALINSMAGKPIIIFNILSVAAVKAFPQAGLYSASKAALASYSGSLREEIRSSGSQIINIYPGATKTGVWPEEMIQEHGANMISPESLATTIRNLIEISALGDIAVEDIVLRPVKGDL